MSEISELKQQVANLTQRLNEITVQARKIPELPEQNPLNPSSLLHVSNSGVSQSVIVQQILDAALSYRQNQLVSIGTISVAGNDVTIPSGATWIINNIDYSNISDIVINVPYAADGFTRTDIIVADQLNNMYRVNGPETAGVSVQPNTPLNTVLVTVLDVTDDSINYTPPVIGDIYELISNKQNSLNPDGTGIKFPTVDAVRLDKVFQDFASYSTYSGLGLNKANSGIILIGDSNSEGYNTVGVSSDNWFNILASELQKNQGQDSGIGFTNLSDLARYGVSKTGTTSIVSKGPTNTAIQMTPNSTLEFTATSDFVEFWFEATASSGKIEFYYNNVLYRTIDAFNASTINNKYSFDGITQTPSGVSGNYKLKCIDANVVVTALFKELKLSEGYDTFFFLRDGVSAKSFASFDITDIKETYGIGSEKNSLFLLNLGTNSIYGGVVATTSAQYEIELTSYLNGLKSATSNVVYVMPPRAMETSYPVILEPYINYYNKAVSVCASLDIVMIDLNDIYLYKPKASCFESDGLHYSLIGHRAIADYMINKLAKIDINEVNRLHDLKINSFPGTVNILPKKSNTGVYSDSRISDNGSEILLNGTTRIPAGTALQLGVPTATNFAQMFFNGTTKKFNITNSSGVSTFVIDDATSLVSVGGLLIGSLAGTGIRTILTQADGTMIAGGLDSENVKTSGTQTVSGQKTFVSQMIVTRPDASTNITLSRSGVFGGNALEVKENTTVNAVITASGLISATSFVKIGATSSDILTGDGTTVVAISNVLTSAGTLTLAVTAIVNYVVFGGTTSTWTLPVPSGNATKKFSLIHTGSGTVTLNTNGGANTLYNGGTLTNTYALMPAVNIELYSDGTKWIIL